MLLARLSRVSLDVAATSARSRKVALLADLFRDTAPDDVPIVIPYLSGRLPQGRLGIGWSTLGDPVPPAAEPTLTVAEVDAELTAVGALSGAGSQAGRRARLQRLLGAATADEQRFLRALLTVLRDVSFAGRGFPVTETAATRQLEAIPQTVVTGFEWG
ncbi:DUF1702 family protein, partial [Streptomyces sp. 24-1644]|uniref:DUF1702 family protein n=1 Tax=Streptomyces sp. 24-1644 TaxID=3457315 RepID=UPI003FA6CBCA